MASTRRTLIVLIVSLSVVMAACTGSDGSEAEDDSVAVPEIQALATTVLQPVTTSTVYDLKSISIDDFYLWAESEGDWDAFLDEAGANCETTVVSLSTMADVLTTQLEETLAMVAAGVDAEVPVEDGFEAVEEYESAVLIGSISAKRLSQQKSIENAHAYTMLVQAALSDLLSEVTGLRSTAVDIETNTIRSDSIAKRVPRVEEAGEAVAKLVYRPPVWECPALRP
jgi:hypothetical protein